MARLASLLLVAAGVADSARHSAKRQGAGVETDSIETGACDAEPNPSDEEIMEELLATAADEEGYLPMLNDPAGFYEEFLDDDKQGSAESVASVHNKFGFCPLQTRQQRLAAADRVGGMPRKMAQYFEEFNMWIWTKGSSPINPATDSSIFNKPGLFGLQFLPSWDQVRSAGLMFTLLPSLKMTDGGNRTTWFMQSAEAACWKPSPFAQGPMKFSYADVASEVTNTAQQRGYYTSTVPQHPDFFSYDMPLFIHGDRHRRFRNIVEKAGFARRWAVNSQVAAQTPLVSGCAPPPEADVGKYVNPLVLEAIWGSRPPQSALDSAAIYLKSGKVAIFGATIHAIVGPLGMAKKVKDSAAVVSNWAKTTPFANIWFKARDALEGNNEWFRDNQIEDLTTATLFAGVIGTTDMTLKCVTYQKRNSQHQNLFKQNPEKYLIELMRYDSAVTSTTEVLRNDTAMNFQGREFVMKKGTPTQLVLATANRDPVHWSSPEAFNPDRKNLGDQLAWNGKAADTERRDLDKAPRHCPGYCLSLKVAAAVCAGMMGSFEELKNTGKILQNGGKVKCTNFGLDSEPPLWNP